MQRSYHLYRKHHNLNGNCHYIHCKILFAMNKLLILATILITLALVFYTTGIWSERLSKYLKGWHVAAFWAGIYV